MTNRHQRPFLLCEGKTLLETAIALAVMAVAAMGLIFDVRLIEWL